MGIPKEPLARVWLVIPPPLGKEVNVGAPKEPLARIWNNASGSALYPASTGIATGANNPEPVTDLREKIASIDFCWVTCGERAETCTKQLGCAAFGDRQNKSYAHPTLDTRKANQIVALFKEALPELAREAGYVRLAKDWNPPIPLYLGNMEIFTMLV